jgi:hypothetical protein
MYPDTFVASDESILYPSSDNLESSPEGFIHEVITPSPGSRNAPIADVKDISHFQENDQGKTNVNADDYLIFFFLGFFATHFTLLIVPLPFYNLEAFIIFYFILF